MASMTIRAPVATKAVKATSTFRGQAVSAAPMRAARTQMRTKCMALVRDLAV